MNSSMNSSRCPPKRMRSREKKIEKKRKCETQPLDPNRTLVCECASQTHVCVSASPFLFFFFFFSMLMNSNKYCSCTVQETNFTVHETHNYFIKKKILKMGLKVLFIHLKIILLQCFSIFIFQFSVFNFQLYPLYSNGSHFILISLFVQVQVL